MASAGSGSSSMASFHSSRGHALFPQLLSDPLGAVALPGTVPGQQGGVVCIIDGPDRLQPLSGVAGLCLAGALLPELFFKASPAHGSLADEVRRSRLDVGYPSRLFQPGQRAIIQHIAGAQAEVQQFRS